MEERKKDVTLKCSCVITTNEDETLGFAWKRGDGCSVKHDPLGMMLAQMLKERKDAKND